jgi:CheY-like chemotaxis protein
MQSASVEPALETILLIDDDLELSDTMSEFLKIHGYATLQAQNGQNAIDLLKTMATVPLLIVLDMSMPVLDGRGFLKRRAKDPVLLPVSIYSRLARHEDINDCRKRAFRRSGALMFHTLAITRISTMKSGSARRWI